jgi:hypothetical protein
VHAHILLGGSSDVGYFKNPTLLQNECVWGGSQSNIPIIDFY